MLKTLLPYDSMGWILEMYGILFILVLFLKTWALVWNEFCLVRFKKMKFGSDITVIYYSCDSKYYSDSG